MKRHCGHFEEKPGSEQYHAEHEQINGSAARSRNYARNLPRNAFKVGLPRESVYERDAVKKNARGESAEKEIFHRGFVRFLISLEVTDQNIDRDRHQLKRDVERQQVVTRSQKHHSDGREEYQAVVLAVLLLFDIEKFDGYRNR